MKKTTFVLAALLAFGLGTMSGCNESADNEGSIEEPKPTPNEDPNPKPNIAGELGKLVKSLKVREDSQIEDNVLKAFVKSQYDLNYDILRSSGDDIAKNNAMISTYSIQTALAMVYGGANGETASEMKSALKLGENPHSALNKLDKTILALNKEAVNDLKEDGTEGEGNFDAIEIKTSNNLYFAPGVTWAESWLDLLATNYGAGIWEMDFQNKPEEARKHINDVVAKDTKDRIKDLLPDGSVSNLTSAVITNAIYFKAPWSDELSKAEEQVDFTKSDNSKVKVTMLEDTLHNARYASGEKWQAVVEPMRDGAFGALLILPDEGEFDNVMASLNGDLIFTIIESMGETPDVDKVELAFPMYEFNTSISLKKTLQSLGMTKAFSSDADFSRMTTDPNDFFIDDVYHKTFIGVDEKGIEAAAATAVMVAGEAAEPKIIKLTFDRPFMFVIYETQTRAPLFVGHVMDPSAKGI